MSIALSVTLVSCRLVGDTAWHPMPRSEYDALGDGGKVAVQIGLGPLRFLASIGHWYALPTFLLSPKQCCTADIHTMYSARAENDCAAFNGEEAQICY